MLVRDELPDARLGRVWLRRLCKVLAFSMAAALVALGGFLWWVGENTVPVLVVDESGRSVGGVELRAVLVAGNMTSAAPSPGKPVWFQVEPSGGSAALTRHPSQTRIRYWASHVTRPFAITLVADLTRPIYSASGAFRVPRHSNWVAIPGNWSNESDAVFRVAPGQFDESGGEIVIERQLPPPSWFTKRVTWTFEQATLQDLARTLEADTGAKVSIDWQALEDEGVSPRFRFDYAARAYPLQRALNDLLGDVNATYLWIDDVLYITSWLEAACRFETKIYPASDLIAHGTGKLTETARELEESIISLFAPHSWQTVGGPADCLVSERQRALVVCQSQRTHREIERLTADLRDPRSESPSPEAQHLADKLAKHVSLEFSAIPFGDVLDHIKQLSGIENIELDKPATEEEGITRNTPITCSVREMPLIEAVQQMLRAYGLEAVVDGEYLQITSGLEVGRADIVQVYPVADLIAGDNRSAADDLIRSIKNLDHFDLLSHYEHFSITTFRQKEWMLGIRHSAAGHAHIKAFLDDKRSKRVGK